MKRNETKKWEKEKKTENKEEEEREKISYLKNKSISHTI